MLKTWFADYKHLRKSDKEIFLLPKGNPIEVIKLNDIKDRWNTLIKGWEGEIVSIGIKAIKDDITDFSKTVEIFVLEEKIELAKEELKLLKGL